jgi:hypothetical protein
MENEASHDDLQAFVNGLGITPEEYEQIEPKIRPLNLLQKLDKYRWAIDSGIDDIEDYKIQLRMTLPYV